MRGGFKNPCQSCPMNSRIHELYHDLTAAGTLEAHILPGTLVHGLHYYAKAQLLSSSLTACHRKLGMGQRDLGVLAQ